MGSIPDKSAITKYKILPLTETLLYIFLVSFISTSTIFDCSILPLISVDFYFEFSKISINVSSSNIYSNVASDNNFKILFSRSFNVFASAAIVNTISSLFASTSGFSAITTSPKSYCSRPSNVTVKLIKVTLIQISGI